MRTATGWSSASRSSASYFAPASMPGIGTRVEAFGRRRAPLGAARFESVEQRLHGPGILQIGLDHRLVAWRMRKASNVNPTARASPDANQCLAILDRCGHARMPGHRSNRQHSFRGVARTQMPARPGRATRARTTLPCLRRHQTSMGRVLATLQVSSASHPAMSLVPVKFGDSPSSHRIDGSCAVTT